MLLILDSPASSSHKVYERVSTLIEVRPSYTHEARPSDYTILPEGDSKAMLLAYAQKSFANDWDLDNEEENAYWESL